jgi:asparaginyl-tRNA synthetase
MNGLRALFSQEDIVELRVPTLVGPLGSCENPATVIQADYGTGSSLTQTGQLALEQLLSASPAVWCHASSYRREAEDSRHLMEFDLLEEEFRQSDRSDNSTRASEARLTGLIERITVVVKAMVAAAVEHCPAEIRTLGGSVEDLERIVTGAFQVISYSTALEWIAVGSSLPPVPWGTDLGAAHEAAVLEVAAARAGFQVPVFVTNYPEQMKFFNMKVDPDDRRVVLSADLLLPYAGETVGAAVREDDWPTLSARFERLMLPRLELRWPDGRGRRAFEPYLDALKAGRLAPHAGYGIGLERVLQCVTRGTDIRNVSLPVLLRELLDERPSG